MSIMRTSNRINGCRGMLCHTEFHMDIPFYQDEMYDFGFYSILDLVLLHFILPYQFILPLSGVSILTIVVAISVTRNKFPW